MLSPSNKVAIDLSSNNLRHTYSTLLNGTQIHPIQSGPPSPSHPPSSLPLHTRRQNCPLAYPTHPRPLSEASTPLLSRIQSSGKSSGRSFTPEQRLRHYYSTSNISVSQQTILFLTKHWSCLSIHDLALNSSSIYHVLSKNSLK